MEDEIGGPFCTCGEKRNSCRVLVGKQEGKRPLGRAGRVWKVVLKWLLKGQNGLRGLDYPGSEQGQVAGSCEHCIEP